ncbi:MAG: sulfite exporter TauE/SafE family protein [Bacteroidota bacterium]
MIWSALVLGFLGSLHCLGMCGPIAFMLSLDHTSTTKKMGQLILYHLGRILAYALLGSVFGLLGKSFELFGLQQKLSIGVGIMMIVLAFFPSVASVFQKTFKPWQRWIIKLRSIMGTELKKRTPDTFLTIGFLNGLLPCGLVYMAILAALAIQSPWGATLYMMLFGLGTIPLMSAIVFSKGWFQRNFKMGFNRFIPIFIGVMGALFIIRGLGLGIPYLSPKLQQNAHVTAQIECHQP